MKRSVSGTMLMLLLMTMLSILLNIKPVESQPRTIIVPDDYLTIQEAINNAVDGDAIYVRAGTYYENVVVNKTIILIGESRENTIIDGKGVGKVLELTVDGILISNFTITNGEVGIHITNSHKHMIRNNIIARNVRGATGTYYTYTTYENNLVKENEYGLDFGHLGGPSSSHNFAINNEFYDNFVGIYVSASEGNNTIENNLFYKNNIGVVLDNTQNNQVIGNTFVNNTREGGFNHGIYLRNAAHNRIERNSFISNNVGVFMDRGYKNVIQRNNFTSNSYGVYLTFNESLTYWGWSFNNQIIKNCFLNNTYGVYSNIGAAAFINSQFNTTILENEIKNNVYGVFLYLSPVNIIWGNILLQNDYGLHIELSSGNFVTNNTIAGNRINGLTLHLSSDNSLILNNIIRSNIGLALSLSSNNLICRNVIADNNIGIKIESNGNTIYNNDFVDNVQHVATDWLWSGNKWNATYPIGGNYWSDYVGIDVYRGPYQNETGSDGIGDTPYLIYKHEFFGKYYYDYYPLMKPCILKCYTINITSTMGGTTDPSPGTYTYVNGTIITVTAIPNAGYSFDHWLFDGSLRTENPITVIMNTNHTLIAYFIDDTAPVTADNYDGLWHNANFTITLTSIDHGSGVAETYYRINNGPVKAVSVDGQPLITVEGVNNTLEYWSVDWAGNEELPHKILTGIKLDKTAPSIVHVLRVPEDNVEPGQDVKVSVNVTDLLSGVQNVVLSYTLNHGTSWNNLTMTYNSTNGLYETTIKVQQANVQVKYKIIAYDIAGNCRVEDNSGQYYTYTVIPEFSLTIILTMFMLTTTILLVLTKKRRLFMPRH
jgi:parallel beta-helix repeat protein